MRRAFPFLVYSLALLLALTAAGCKRATEAAPAPAEAAMPPFIPDHTIKDLMLNVVDTNADVVWLSVTTTVHGLSADGWRYTSSTLFPCSASTGAAAW